MDERLRSSSDLLARLMRSDLSPPEWPKKDLGAILKHQLAAPLVFDLGARCYENLQADQVAVGGNQNIRSFGDLLAHPQPPLELLRLTKDFAKGCDTSENAPLPTEIATVLYFACLAAAVVRLKTRISELADARVLEGIHWCISQQWLDPGLATLFHQAAAQLK